MDPSAAIGVAAAVLQFACFSTKAIASIREVAKAGSTASNAHTLLLTKDLNDVAGQLVTTCDLGSSDHALALKEIVADCAQSCAQLTQLLTALSLETTTLHTASPQEPAARSRWRSKLAFKKIQVGIKSVWKKEEIEELEMRIGKSRDQVMLRLQTLLVERQSTIHLELSGFRSKSESDTSFLKDHLEILCQSVSGLEAQLSRKTVGSQVMARASELQLLQATLHALIQNTPTPEVRILKKLFYQSMNSRKQHIKPSHEKTHSWILSEDSEDIEPKALGKYKSRYSGSSSTQYLLDLLQDRAAKCREGRERLITWLRSGDGVFHISGKAGSGKSTLMKTLLNHPRTRRELGHWAETNTLIISHFFFWRSGDVLQNSLTGLYQSILFEVLKECPELIPLVFPAAYRVFSSQARENCIEEAFFDQDHIQRAFGKLVSGSIPPGYRFCLFIDGLDEYGEDGRDRLEHEQLARSLSTWSQQKSIKIVATSRPYVEFEREFSPKQRIHLHDLVWFDIFSFSHDTFEKHRDFHRIEKDYDDLSARVADHSDGVFLWAAITIRSLHSSIANHAARTELYKQLDDTPKELGALYHSLLELLSPRDRLRASKMLLMTYAAVVYRRALDPCVLSWVDEWDNPAFPLNTPPGPYSSEEYSRRVDMVVAQLDGVTNGLLELRTAHDLRSGDYVGSRFLAINDMKAQPFVQFYHRTIRDFVVTNTEMRATLTAHPQFTADVTFSRVFLSALWLSSQPVDTKCLLGTFLQIVGTVPTDLFNSFKTAWLLISPEHMHILCATRMLQVWVVGPPSFHHWAVSAWEDLPDSELDQMVHARLSEPEQRDGSLLFSAAGRGRVKIVERLLLRGWSPNEKILVAWTKDAVRKITVWVGLCVYLFACFEEWRLRGRHRETRTYTPTWFFSEADSQVLEAFLQAGASPDVHYKSVIGLPDMDPSTWRREDISLLELVMFLDPPNRDRLAALMERGRGTTSASTLLEHSSSHGLTYDDSLGLEEDGEGGFQVHVIERTLIHRGEVIEYGAPFNGRYNLILPGFPVSGSRMLG
ncbi:hypothetical protein QBC39DRAFT_291206 [Podospora conica]|nr:hypothetical protein QBC39DRAFT_291206 [Schizothecium conicum]